MITRRRFLRPSLVAIAAIWGALLATPGMAEASVARGRRCDSAPALASCCVGRPETCNLGCCPSSASALSRTGTDEAAAPARLSTAWPVCIPSACQCRSSEPVAPGSTPDRRTTDDRSNHGEGVSLAWLGHVLTPAPAFPVAPSEAGRLKSPLYVLTTHLRF
jgi:hypothetical protein